MRPRNAMISPAECIKPVDIKRDNMIINYFMSCSLRTESKTCIDCETNPKSTISMTVSRGSFLQPHLPSF